MVNTDVAPHLQKTPDKILVVVERKNKRKYLDSCMQQRIHFSPFVVSIIGILSTKMEATLKRRASRLTTKWRQSYSCTCRYVQSRVAITMVRSTHRCIRLSRVPESLISVQQLQCEDGAGIDLYK